MNKPETKEGARLLACTSRVVSAYAAGNKLGPNDLINLVMQVAQAFVSAKHARTVTPVSLTLTPENLVQSIRLGRIDGSNPRRLTPDEIEASIQDQYLVSFENGRHYFLMRRHLTDIGMTPDEYRAEWGLPDDYPVVAPYFARRRIQQAKDMSLGHHERPPRKAPPPGQAQVPAGGRSLRRKRADRGGHPGPGRQRPGTTEHRAARHGDADSARGGGTGAVGATENPRASRRGGDGNA